MRRLAGAMALVAGFVLVVGPGPVQAEAPEATAWWWAASPDALALPASAPSPVEPGGLYVAGEPTGPAGKSALRVPVDDNQAVDELVLVIDTDERTGQPKAQGDVAVEACAATRVWAPEEGGPMARAPACEPGSFAFGSVADGKVRFRVGGLVRNGMLNIVIQPTLGKVFQVAFEKPGKDAIVMTTYAGQSDDGGAPAGYEDFAAFDPGAAFGVPVEPVAPPSVFEAVPLPTAPAAVAPSAPATGPSVNVPASTVPPGARRASTERTPQVVSAMVLVGLILMYLGLLQAPGHIPQLLGPFRRESVAPAVPAPTAIGELPRGIGRFARPRLGPAPKL